MRKYITIICALFFLQCRDIETGPQAGKTEIEIGKSISAEGYSFQVLTIGNCEYVSYSVGANFGLFSHKGDCANPIHKCKCE